MARKKRLEYIDRFHMFKLVRPNGFSPKILQLPRNLLVSSENPWKTKEVPEN